MVVSQILSCGDLENFSDKKISNQRKHGSLKMVCSELNMFLHLSYVLSSILTQNCQRMSSSWLDSSIVAKDMANPEIPMEKLYSKT